MMHPRHERDTAGVRCRDGRRGARSHGRDVRRGPRRVLPATALAMGGNGISALALEAARGWEGGCSFCKTGVKDLAGACGEGRWPGLMNPATRGHKAAAADLAAAHRALRDKHLALGRGGGLAVAVCIEGSGAGGRAVFCWAGGRVLRGCTPRLAGYHKGKTVVGEEEGRVLVWHAAHHGFKFKLRLVSRRQGGCGRPKMEGA
ncbi:hypothetical protein B0H14DRAFT_2621208 [Mycena olivaceomarginata]|nr:hypothetical protein B0H14DRAFT_2621208 [Mycena olivaceomarginata]